MYFYGCLLLAMKQIILKELPTYMSLALLHGYSYIFSPSITDKTTAQARSCQETGQDLGVSSQMVGKFLFFENNLENPYWYFFIPFRPTEPFASHSHI